MKALLAKPLDLALGRAERANAAMLDKHKSGRHGSRKRALPAMLVGFVGLGTMYQLVGAGVLAVNFNTSNAEFQLYSNYLQGENAAGYLNRSSRIDGNNVGVAEIGIKTAKLAGLCAIAKTTLPVLGDVYMTLAAGDTVAPSFSPSYTAPANPAPGVNGTFAADATHSVTVDSASGQLTGASNTSAIVASNLFINTDSLSGYGNLISGLNLGESAGTIQTTAGVNFPTPGANMPPVPGSTDGSFGLTASKLNVGALSGSTYGINLAGSINLPKLKLKVVTSSSAVGQSQCITAAS